VNLLKPTLMRLRDECWQSVKGWARLCSYFVGERLGQRGGLSVLHYDIANWGDAINPVLVEMISGQPVQSFDIDARRALPLPKPDSDNEIYLVVGSILHHADAETVVWGSGFQGPNLEPRQPPRRVTAVRGPLSAARLRDLGIPCPDVYGDPVLLLPRYYQPPKKKLYRLGLVPHRKDFHDPVIEKFRGRDDVQIVNLRGPLWATVNAICECEAIVSSSLHGLVVADAYGIPSAWARISEKIPGGGFKFRDYYRSLGANIEDTSLTLQDDTVDDLVRATSQRDIGLSLDALLDSCPFKRS